MENNNQSMSAYGYHPYTGEYIGEVQSTIDMLASEKAGQPQYLLPANALWEAPDLKPGENECIGIDKKSGRWKIFSDWRQVALYKTDTGEEFYITDIGVLPQNVGGTSIKPSNPDIENWDGSKWVLNETKVAQKLKNDKAMVWEAIKAERDKYMEFGGYKIDDSWFHSDQKSRTQQLGLAMLGQNIPEGKKWKTMDGSFVEMTPALAAKFLPAAAASDFAIFAAAEAHRVAMKASNDPLNYDYSTNWPPSFQDETT